jgi:hypothetical protein
MDQNNVSSSRHIHLEVTDEEHTLILLMRTINLNEMIYVMALNNYLPVELPDKHRHIMNIINLYYNRSYELHTIRTVVEFISTHSTYSQMFQHHELSRMIKMYQLNRPVESTGVYYLYLKPFTTQCIQCKKQLNQMFRYRPKTVVSLAKVYQACK